jgi:hypothetical protein
MAFAWQGAVTGRKEHAIEVSAGLSGNPEPFSRAKT